MREFKFRFWTKALGMSDPGDIYSVGVMMLEGFEPEAILQYTGLKDKNGKEIYEGDVIKTDDGHISPVFYEEDCFCVKVCTNTEALFTNIRRGMAEVIGNLYENPELCTK